MDSVLPRQAGGAASRDGRRCPWVDPWVKKQKKLQEEGNKLSAQGAACWEDQIPPFPLDYFLKVLIRGLQV